MILKEYLLAQGYEQLTPFMFDDSVHKIVNVIDVDSYGFEIWSITNKRYDEIVFRGRITGIMQFNKIMSYVKEDYDLSEEEIDELKNAL